MINISSQDYRNAYEKFYAQLRLYLWPYQVLKELADVEVDIYSAFIDIAKLSKDFAKLKSSINEMCKEDEKLDDLTRKLENLINEKDTTMYHRLNSVAEVNPQIDKHINIGKEDNHEDQKE